VDGKRVQTIRTHGISGRMQSCLLVSPDGKSLAVTAKDKKVKLYPLLSKKSIALAEPVWIEISPVAFLSDGAALATFGWENLIRLWKPATGKFAAALPISDKIDALAFSPDGKYVAVDRYVTPTSTEVNIWDVRTGKLRCKGGSLKSRVFALAYSPTGKVVAAADQYGNLQLLDAASGKILHELKGHTDFIVSLAFSPDGRTLVSGAREKGDGTLRFWDVSTGKQRAVRRCPHCVWAMTFRRSGQVLYTASAEGAVRVWDVPRRWKVE
jgi:WD40 repeat protein